MVLVDTSVWIRFLAKRAPYADELSRLLSEEEVVGHELVYGELLVGDTGGRRTLLDAYARIDQTQRIPHKELVEFVSDRKLNGRGVGWSDIHLLASAIVGRLGLWTANGPFSALAAELGVAYKP